MALEKVSRSNKSKNQVLMGLGGGGPKRESAGESRASEKRNVSPTTKAWEVLGCQTRGKRAPAQGQREPGTRGKRSKIDAPNSKIPEGKGRGIRKHKDKAGGQERS